MGFGFPGLKKLKDAFSKDPGVRAPASGLEGQTLDGRFKIVRRIGVGGMGTVYLARQTSMDRDVAIKVLNPDKLDDDDARKRFRIEAAAVSKLKSPHTISVYDFGEDNDGEMYLVMELLEGRPLADIIKDEGTLDINKVLRIAEQILDSLGEAHNAGILHRDMKPDNVFVMETAGTGVFVKVLDFGIAKLMGGPDASRTWPGLVIGTPAYMSPEQVMGKRLDNRSDLYSVAVVMFEMLSGGLPVTGKTPIEIGVKKVRSMPSKLAFVNGTIAYPEGADAFFARTLNPDPRKRPANAAEFKQLIQDMFGIDLSAISGSANTAIQLQLPNIATAGDSIATTPAKIFLTDSNAIEAAFEAERKRTAKSSADGPPEVDRRWAIRLPKLSTVKCYYNGSMFDGTAGNMSATGGFIHSTWLPVVSHRVTITFTCPGTKDWNIGILAEVVRTSQGSGNPGDVRGFGVRWIKLRARGGLPCLTDFFTSSLGKDLKTSLPELTNANQWEYLFAESKFI